MENVGKWTPSDPMGTDCRRTSPSDCHVSVREELIIYTAKYSCEGVENVGKRTPMDPMETGCRGSSPSDCRVSVRELWRGWKMSPNGLHRIRWRRVAV